jgi:uncharacterized surface protein with fasciclin (FAS1) repeats
MSTKTAGEYKTKESPDGPGTCIITQHKQAVEYRTHYQSPSSTSSNMRTNLLLAASAATFVAAQDLATVLSGQESLSTLVGLLGKVENTTEFLASQKNVTLFAPSNDALATIVQSGGIFSIDQAVVDPGLIEQILRYHLFKGVVKAADIVEIPQFVPSYLNYSGFVLDGEVSGSNVTGRKTPKMMSETPS